MNYLILNRADIVTKSKVTTETKLLQTRYKIKHFSIRTITAPKRT